MLSNCTDYLATMPDITINMNCNTRLAINLDMFALGDKDELVFTIKNYNHIKSTYAVLVKARKGDEDENGEVLFNISPEESKKIKPGAFYSFSFLVNGLDPNKVTEYRKVTDNGRILIEYGAQDLAQAGDLETSGSISGVRLELLEAGEEEIILHV